MVVERLRMQRLERSRIANAAHFGLQALLVTAEHMSMAELCELSVTHIVCVPAWRLHTVVGDARLYSRMELPGILTNTQLSDS